MVTKPKMMDDRVREVMVSPKPMAECQDEFFVLFTEFVDGQCCINCGMRRWNDMIARVAGISAEDETKQKYLM